MQHHLQQEIAEFLLEMAVIAVANGIRHFVGFFQHVGHQRLVGLFQVNDMT